MQPSMTESAPSVKHNKKMPPVKKQSLSSFDEQPPAKPIINDKLPTILLANDDPFLIFTHFHALKAHFNIHTADNGYDAFEQVKANPKSYFSAIIVDINMPIMDGFEACVLINNYLEGGVPIFALSADVDTFNSQTLDKYPFEAYFSKLECPQIEKISRIAERLKNAKDMKLLASESSN